ncbi:MAG: choice-of-anchor B family protein [Gammaproteobacteria bacterium]|nr:choice-of-anchor B family protein [Gammaproteobacteria bacterium]
MKHCSLGFCLLVILGQTACGGGNLSPPEPPPDSAPGDPPSLTTPSQPPEELTTDAHACGGGSAGDFACKDIALLSRISLDTMEGGSGNDVWGWFDSLTDREYALMGLDNGTAFVDVSDPESPVFLGRLPTRTYSSTWRDIKVYDDHAYIVADDAGAHGMQVFDLTRLRDQTMPQTFFADQVYVEFDRAHNLAINELSGFAYAVGTNTCEGGLHMIDLSMPINPLFVGCHSADRTHDTQCVTYEGPDDRYQGKEVCFSSNYTELEIVDVSSKSSPITISTAIYDNLGIVHQGWLTEDHQFFLLGDEIDESIYGFNTRTHVFDVADLESPRYVYAFEHDTEATDHNLYVLDNRVFEANYSVGLQVLEFTDPSTQDLQSVASFDTYPDHDNSSLIGAWSVYPYLPSEVILVSDIVNGLFVLEIE